MNFEACREITRKNAKSFYFASFPLPREKRDATFATYAFCRTADDIVDECGAGGEEEAREKLNELRALLHDIDRGATPDHPLWGPFAHSIHRYRIPIGALETLLDGVESDLEPRRFRSFLELRNYCFQVASTVGIALSHIFGYGNGKALDYAANMGIAMQLTNIVRDIGADYRLGRVYLPFEELREFGCSEATIARGQVTPELRRLLEFQIRRAREYYRRAFQGIRFLTRDGSHWTAFLMGDVYRGILDQVERNDYDVFRRRASVTFAGKLTRTMFAPVTFRRDVLQESAALMRVPEEMV